MSVDAAEIAVVGAGFTGLVAALRLVEAGRRVIVLEAHGRVGGRVASATLPSGMRLDTGGQFLCQDMPEAMSLARDCGKRLVKTRVDGRTLMEPPVSDDDAQRIWRGATALRDRLNEIDIDGPGVAGLTVVDWLARQPDEPDAKAAFRSTIEGLWCQSIDRIPLWYLVDNDRRVTNTVPELQYFLADTMHELAESLAARLGDRLRLASRVDGIRVRHDAVDLTLGDETLDARAALVAVPPSQAARIRFTPSLPPAIADALAAWESGSVIKILIEYDRAFWRDRGLSGMVAWRDPHGLFVCDTTKRDDQPALVVFVGGPLSRSWAALGDEGLRETVLAKLSAALGPAAALCESFTAQRWIPDEGEVGGYSDLVMRLDARQAETILRAGLPPLYFASSELSPSFPGYVEGAIVAGRHAAERIIADLF